MNLLWQRRALAAAVSLVAAAGGVVLVAGTAQAQPVTTGTFSFSGPKGEYITQGQSYSYDTGKGDQLDVSSRGPNQISVWVKGYNGDDWMLQITASGGPLAPGSYTEAHRFPGPGAGMDLFGEGRGCNESTGSFTVQKAIITASGYVQAFDATFEQHCENGTAAIRGQVHIANPVAPPEPTPTTARPRSTTPTAGAGAGGAAAGTSPSPAVMSEVARTQYEMIGFGVIAWAFFLVAGLLGVGVVMVVRGRRMRRPIQAPAIDAGGTL